METGAQSSAAFPRELLEQPVNLRRQYFETKVVAHHHLKEVHEKLLHAIRYPAGASLILVFGPTGVGKTTMRLRIEKQLIDDAVTEQLGSPGHIPVVGMEAPSPDSGNFSWRDFYTRALVALHEPMITHKMTSELRGLHQDDQGRLIIERNVTAPDLRRVLEKCLLYRQPRAFILDEAQHLKKMTSGRRLLDQMDTLKSLASLSNTVHVLVGTYDLLGVMNLSAQLSRRSIDIHFPRYHADSSEDFKEFRKLLRTFQRHLPLTQEPDLVSHADYFYEHCLGCTGMLKTWLNRTLAAALEQQERTLPPKLWERHAESPQKLLHMVREIREGERTLQEDDTHRRDLRALLKLAEPSVEDGSSLPSSQPPSSPRSKRQRVGQRRAKRDPVGKEDLRAR
jgi:hypothetical protein